MRTGLDKSSLRGQALSLILIEDADEKAAAVLVCDPSLRSGSDDAVEPVEGIPGRPARPPLVPHTELKQRSVRNPEGRAALVHAIAHIERNAIDLALDAVWRFAGLPDAYYQQWMRIATEEAHHFTLLRDHLASLGYAYGDFPAHNALWEMAEKTKGDVLARMALVPRTLEARGLDASPPIRDKFIGIGDNKAAAILDIILRDEIGHVAVGNYWFRWLCTQRSVDPIKTFSDLAAQYGAPRLRGPFNLEARRAAGFEENELLALFAEK